MQARQLTIGAQGLVVEEHQVLDARPVGCADSPSEVAVTPAGLSREVFLPRVLRVVDEQIRPFEELLNLFVLLPGSERSFLDRGSVIAGILGADVEKIAVRLVIIGVAEDFSLVLEPVAEYEDGVIQVPR